MRNEKALTARGTAWKFLHGPKQILPGPKRSLPGQGPCVATPLITRILGERNRVYTVQRVSFTGENLREFRVSVAIRESFLRENLFSSN